MKFVPLPVDSQRAHIIGGNIANFSLARPSSNTVQIAAPGTTWASSAFSIASGTSLATG